MKERIRIRRDTATNWNNYNPVLGIGEAGYETDSNKLKIGNGLTHWSGLPYLMGSQDGINNLRIGDGYYDYLSWATTGRLDLVGSGGTSLYFEPATNRIIFYSPNSLNANLTKANITGVLGYLPQPTGYYSVSGHTHTIADIDNLQSVLNTKQSTGIYASGYHQHQLSDISGLISSLAGKQSTGNYSTTGHTHELYISNGTTRAITYNSNEDLIIKGSGNTYIGFNDSTNTITIGSIYDNPGSNFTFITVTGDIPLGQTTPTDIKFSYPGVGIDDIITVDALLKRLVDLSNSGTITKNVVTTTGSQQISGVKTFVDNTIFSGNITAKTGNLNFIQATGSIPINQITPTNIKFNYPNIGIDDITTLDAALKKIVEKTLYTEISASLSSNLSSVLQPGYPVSSITFTVTKNTGSFYTGIISNSNMNNLSINNTGNFSVNLITPLNSGQNQSHSFVLSYNDYKRSSESLSTLSSSNTIRFYDYKYYGISLSGSLSNISTHSNLESAMTIGSYGKAQTLSRSLSYTYQASDSNQYYLWYIFPSGGFTAYSTTSDNFISSSNVTVGGFNDSNWKYMGSYSLTNAQNYTHPYYFYRYNQIQVGPFNLPVSFI